MLIVALMLSIGLAVGEGYLLYRATRSLLRFDDIFQGLIPILDEYSTDLTRMTSANIDGILVDHPEVARFHARNMRARVSIQQTLDSIMSVTPRRKKKTELPRPDVE
jgi:hypothetical protein